MHYYNRVYFPSIICIIYTQYAYTSYTITEFIAASVW